MDEKLIVDLREIFDKARDASYNIDGDIDYSLEGCLNKLDNNTLELMCILNGVKKTKDMIKELENNIMMQ